MRARGKHVACDDGGDKGRSSSAKLSTLYHNFPQSYLLYISTLYQLTHIILFFFALYSFHCTRPVPLLPALLGADRTTGEDMREI